MEQTEYVKDWGLVYNKANTVFIKATMELAKIDKKVSAEFKKTIDEATDSAEWLGCLSLLDKTNMNNVDIDKPGYKDFKALVKKTEVVHKKYVATIKSIMDKKIKAAPNGFVLTMSMKEGHPDAYRQLRVMEEEVKAITNRALQTLVQAEEVQKTIALVQEKAKVKLKTKIEDLPALNQEFTLKQQLIGLGPKFKSAMSKGAAAIQKIKADPTPENYNAQMEAGGRDISQQLKNLQNFRDSPAFRKTSYFKKLPDPSPFVDVIEQFGNGNFRTIAANSTPKQVTDRLDIFSTTYKQVVVAYADLISGKIK